MMEAMEPGEAVVEEARMPGEAVMEEAGMPGEARPNEPATETGAAETAVESCTAEATTVEATTAEAAHARFGGRRRGHCTQEDNAAQRDHGLPQHGRLLSVFVARSPAERRRNAVDAIPDFASPGFRFGDPGYGPLCWLLRVSRDKQQKSND
jgi:hypothetical protein